MATRIMYTCNNMQSFVRQIRSFLRRAELWLTAAEDSEAILVDDVDDIVLLGESIHRHMVAMVEAGEDVSSLGQHVGGLVDSLSTIANLLDNQVDRRAFTAILVAEEDLSRPRLYIAQDQLEFLLDHGFAASDIARLLGVSRSTICRRMRDWGLTVSRTYTAMDDAALDRAVLEVKREFPDAGYRMMHGLLRARGFVVQRHRIRQSLARIDPVGCCREMGYLHPKKNLQCQWAKCLVAHIDGNHKLRYIVYSD